MYSISIRIVFLLNCVHGFVRCSYIDALYTVVYNVLIYIQVVIVQYGTGCYGGGDWRYGGWAELPPRKAMMTFYDEGVMGPDFG